MRKTNPRHCLFTAALLAATPLLARAQVAPQPSPLAEARKAIVTARAEVAKDKQVLDRARAKVEATFAAGNPEYATAQKAYEKAQFDLKIATTQAMARLQANPDYVAAVKAKEATKAKMAELATDSKATEEDRQKVQNDMLALVNSISQLEAGATANDPKITEDKQRVADSKQALDDLKTKLDAACATDPEYQQAFQTEAAAEQQLTQAEQSFKDQAKQQAEAAAAAAKAKAAASSSGTGQPAPPPRR